MPDFTKRGESCRCSAALARLDARVPVGAPLVYAAGTLVAGDAKGTVYGFRVGPKRSAG